MPKSTVIIPVFNQAPLTAQCVRTLLRSDHEEIVVVNDASTDATPEILAGFGSQLKTITHTANLGFAASCNDGAKLATGEYLVFLNNDTLPQPGWLEALIHYADDHPQAAVIGSKLIYPNGTIQHAGVVICQDHYPRHIYSGFPADHPATNKSRPFQIVTAACMLVRRRMFHQAGGFDLEFRNGFEDVDFCLRLGAGGHEIHYCPQSLVQHLESVSPGRFRYDGANVALYRERWIRRVRPDDLDYYIEDHLLSLTYEGRYPISIEFCPRLATLDSAARTEQLERALRERNREMAELQRENTRLLLELGARAQPSHALEYQRLRRRIREIVRELVPQGSTVLVISKGDGALLDFPGCCAWHFPQTERGVYAGCHPADSTEAITHLEALRAKGGQYLLIPATSRWWLDHYAEFRQYLETRCVLRGGSDDSCLIYGLSQPPARLARASISPAGHQGVSPEADILQPDGTPDQSHTENVHTELTI